MTETSLDEVFLGRKCYIDVITLTVKIIKHVKAKQFTRETTHKDFPDTQF